MFSAQFPQTVIIIELFFQVAYIKYLMEGEKLQIDTKVSQNDEESSAPTLKKRRNTLDRIRTSLLAMPLLSANQNMVRSRIKSKGSAFSEENDTDSSPGDFTEIKSEVFKAELFLQKYQLFQKLGEGTNGVVYRCKKRRTSQQFAAKSFRFEEQHLPSLKSNFLALYRLKHPYMIKYEGLYLDVKKLSGWLVMELANFPSLDKVKLTSEDDIKEVMKKVLETLKYLHKHDIVHRDIKAQNILYDEENKNIKIIDFGISRRYRRRGALFEMLTITGTLFYRAPEMFSGGYRQSVDIWAAGILLYSLICGKTPFQTEYHHETIKNILHQELSFTSQFNLFTSQMKNLLRKMLNRDCSERLSAFQCLKHSWFTNLSSPLLKRQATTHQSDDDNSPSLPNKTNYPRKSLRNSDNGQQQSSTHPQFSFNIKGILFNSIISSIKKINDDEIYCIDSDSDSFT